MKPEKLSKAVFRVILSMLFLAFTSPIFADTNSVTVNGLVTDTSGEPLIGATIAVKGTKKTIIICLKTASGLTTTAIGLSRKTTATLIRI